MENKFSYRPFSSLSGVRPIDNEELYNTSTKTFYKEIDNISKIKQNSDEYYRNFKEFQDQEVGYLKKHNKQDHIKKIFSTMNYKLKPSTYSDNFIYDKSKEKETLECDFGNHYKKTSMKTYEESRIKHAIILRK